MIDRSKFDFHPDWIFAEEMTSWLFSIFLRDKTDDTTQKSNAVDNCWRSTHQHALCLLSVMTLLSVAVVVILSLDFITFHYILHWALILWHNSRPCSSGLNTFTHEELLPMMGWTTVLCPILSQWNPRHWSIVQRTFHPSLLQVGNMTLYLQQGLGRFFV